MRIGEASFSAYCATCHGIGARGDGARAVYLDMPVTDLTRLSHSNNGVFPTARVIAKIDGSAEITSHNSPMPPWGQLFSAGPRVRVETDAGPMDANLTVFEIVEWLRTLQQ